MSSQEVETNSAFASGIGYEEAESLEHQCAECLWFHLEFWSCWATEEDSTGPWAGVRPKVSQVGGSEEEDAFASRVAITWLGTVGQGRAFAPTEHRPRRTGDAGGPGIWLRPATHQDILQDACPPKLSQCFRPLAGDAAQSS